MFTRNGCATNTVCALHYSMTPPIAQTPFNASGVGERKMNRT